MNAVKQCPDRRKCRPASFLPKGVRLLLGATLLPIAAVAHADLVPMLHSAPPAIDGMADERVWTLAAPLGEPRFGDGSSGAFAARVLQDRSHLYLAITVEEPAAPASNAGGWGAIWESDWVALAIDSRGSGLGAWFFLMTADGQRLDGVLEASGHPTPVPLVTWRGAVRRAATGYTAEFAIPLAELPYRGSGSQSMGLRIIRRSAARGEEAELAPTDAALSRFRIVSLTSLPPSRRARDGAAFEASRELQAKQVRMKGADVATLQGRVAAYGDASVEDWRIFPRARLQASSRPFRYPRKLNPAGITQMLETLPVAPGQPLGQLDRFLDDTGTTSLLVIHRGQIVYSRYLNHHHAGSVFTSFSTAKSFVSTLVGMAIDRGFIASEDDPVSRYLPELATRDSRFGAIRIADLLHMASGLAYVETGNGERDDQRTYMDPDLRLAALAHSRIAEAPNTHWLYNNYNPILLGMVLERATGQSVTALTQEWLWEPLGMEQAGSWSLDSQASRFEKMESGLNSNPPDFAKLCSLYMADGVWRGRRLLSKRWIDLATQPRAERPGGDYYGWFWWISPREGERADFYAQGNKGQYIYCSPAKDMIVVRTGIRYGLPAASGWPRLFRGLADSIR